MRIFPLRRSPLGAELSAHWREPDQTVAADHSSYFLLARILEHQKKAPGIVAFAYVQASWQVEGDPVQYRDYAQRSLSRYREALLASKDHGAAWKTAQLLAGELERRLGLFAEATTRFMQLVKQEEFQSELFKKIVVYQLELIRRRDSSPHEIPRGETSVGPIRSQLAFAVSMGCPSRSSREPSGLRAAVGVSGRENLEWQSAPRKGSAVTRCSGAPTGRLQGESVALSLEQGALLNIVHGRRTVLLKRPIGHCPGRVPPRPRLQPHR